MDLLAAVLAGIKRTRKQEKPKGTLYAPLSYGDGLDVICTIACFDHLRHLTLPEAIKADSDLKD